MPRWHPDGGVSRARGTVSVGLPQEDVTIKVEFWVGCDGLSCTQHPVFFLPDGSGKHIGYTNLTERDPFTGKYYDILFQGSPSEIDEKHRQSGWLEPGWGVPGQPYQGEIKLSIEEFNAFETKLQWAAAELIWQHSEDRWKDLNNGYGNCAGIFEYLAELAGIDGGWGFIHSMDEEFWFYKQRYKVSHKELYSDLFMTPSELLAEGVGISFLPWGRLYGTNLRKPFDITPGMLLYEFKKLEHVTSWDPNDKIGPTGVGAGYYIFVQQPLEYRIYFENVDSATANAESIWIVDTLDANLDWSTLTIGEIYPDTADPSRPNYNPQVNFDPVYGIITWTLSDINLPPDTVSPNGEGWVSFSILPKSGLPSGTQIKNRACIKFNTNPWLYAPMDSTYVINTIDNLPPTSSVKALPDTATSFNFQVCWSGKDDSLGSGIQNYTIYVSDNGGPYNIWLSNTTDTCSTYAGQSAHHYCFYSIARDNVGSTEQPTGTFDACTNTKSFVCGDLDGQPGIALSDVICLANNVLKGTCSANPLEAANVDGIGRISLADVIYLANYILKGGTAPKCP